MPFLPLVLVLELLSAGVILGSTSFHSPVLGVSTLAQDASPTDTPTPELTAPPSSDQPTQVPITSQEAPTPENTPQSSNAPPTTNSPDSPAPQPTIAQPADTPQITQPVLQNIEQPTIIPSSSDQTLATPALSVTPSVALSDQINLLDQILSNPTPSEEVTPQPTVQSLTPTETQNITFSENNGEQVSSQAVTTILNPDSMVAIPQEIDQQTVQKSQQQDLQIAESHTPQQQNTLLLNFAKDSVKDITNNLKSDDFGTTSFVTQRLDNQVTTSITNLQTIPPSDNKQAKQQVTNFCNQADLVLKSEQLAVPESEEQDVEIVRGKCLNFTQ